MGPPSAVASLMPGPGQPGRHWPHGVGEGARITQISVNGVVRHLGIFDVPQDAARAHDAAARRVFGAFAMTNGFA
jgi:hypothetical protein